MKEFTKTIEGLLVPGSRTVIGSEEDRGCELRRVEHGGACTEGKALRMYYSMKRVWSNVWIFDPDGELCDPDDLRLG